MHTLDFGVEEVSQEYVITDGLYNDAVGWVYGLHPEHADGKAFERNLVRVFSSDDEFEPRSETEIYRLEAFLLYPCRRNHYCVMNFSTAEDRDQHEQKGSCRAEVDINDQDRSVQLELNPKWVRRHDPFCRHTDCTEYFPTIEARNEHENTNCPYGSRGSLRWQLAQLPTNETVGYGAGVPIEIKDKGKGRAVPSDAIAKAGSSKKFECPYPECNMGPNERSIFATEEEAEAHACQEHFGCLMGCGRIWSVERLRDLHHKHCEGGPLT